MTSSSPLKKYTNQLIITGVVLVVVSSLAQIWFEHIHKLWYIILLFMAGVQWLVFAFVLKFGQHKTKTLLKQYQIAKYAKMFIYLIVMAIYVFVININALSFLGVFMVYYIAFTALEIFAFQRWMNTLPQTKDFR
jgi:hypothetical protein